MVSIVPKQSALLVLDVQHAIMSRLQAPDSYIQTLESAISAARKKGIQIAHCRVAFTKEDLANIPDSHLSFARIKQDPKLAAAMDINSPGAQFLDQVAPQNGDIVLRKIRTGPLMTGPSTIVRDEFKKRGIDTVLVCGIATSGAVLSFVRQAADLDYRLVVVEDCCMDPDEEVHRVLMEKVFPRQASVIKAAQIDQL